MPKVTFLGGPLDGQTKVIHPSQFLNVYACATLAVPSRWEDRARALDYAVRTRTTHYHLMREVDPHGRFAWRYVHESHDLASRAATTVSVGTPNAEWATIGEIDDGGIRVGEAEPVIDSFRCASCDVAWEGTANCWSCGEAGKPARPPRIIDGWDEEELPPW